MFKRLLGACVGLAMMGMAGTANAVVITFSEVGVCFPSFTSSDGSILAEWVWSTGQNNGHCHVQASGGNPGAYEAGHGQAFQGIRFSSVIPGPVTLTSFNLRGSWLVGLLNDGSGTLYSGGANWTTAPVGFSSTNPIYIYTNGSLGSASLDNVALNLSQIPEPATITLLATGLAGLGFMGWRRRRRS